MLRSQKTVPFSEQVMSGDKYVSIFSKSYEFPSHMCCVIVFIVLQIFFGTLADISQFSVM